MCNLTISSILQKPNSYVTECTHTLACVVMKRVKRCTHAFRACSFTFFLNALRVIAKFKIWGRKCIYLRFIWFKSHKECSFFLKNKHDYKFDIDFIQISLLLYFFSDVLRLWTKLQWFVPEWINEPFKWFGSVAMTHLLTVTCCHLLAISFHI